MDSFVSQIDFFRKVVRLCRLSYRRPKDFYLMQKFLNIAEERATTEQFKNFDTGAQGFVHVDHQEQTIYIIYAGTQDLTDWGTNLRVRKKPHGPVSIHRGVRAAIRSVRQPVLIAVESYPRYSIVLAGHSLGGMCARAMCMSLIQRYKGEKAITLIDFGAGKIASTKDMNTAITCPHYRFQNGSDAVPRRPQVPFMYGHGNTPNTQHVYFPNKVASLGLFVVNPSSFFIAKDVMFTLFERVYDHDILDYEAKLEEVTP